MSRLVKLSRFLVLLDSHLICRMTNIAISHRCLVIAGNLQAINNVNHGLVEICCMEGHTDLLAYLHELGRLELPVWSKILKLACSELEEEAECAGAAAKTLTTPIDGSVNPNWKNVYDIGGVNMLVKVRNMCTCFGYLILYLAFALCSLLSCARKGNSHKFVMSGQHKGGSAINYVIMKLATHQTLLLLVI